MAPASNPFGERIATLESNMQNLATTVHKLADTTAKVDKYMTEQEAVQKDRDKIDKKRDRRNIMVYTAILGLLSTLLVRGMIGCENHYKLSVNEGVASHTDAGLPPGVNPSKP